MRATIIVDDNTVLVEGIAYAIDCSALLVENIHAVHWYGDDGEIEFSADLRTGDRKPNRKFTNLAPFQPIIDAWMEAAQSDVPVVKDPAVVAARQGRKDAFGADATRADLLTRLRTATPDQINSYVDANVTNLAEARLLFKRILLVLAQV